MQPAFFCFLLATGNLQILNDPPRQVYRKSGVLNETTFRAGTTL